MWHRRLALQAAECCTRVPDEFADKCSAPVAGLTAFLVLKPMTTWLLRAGWTTQPFTAQENTVVQTFAMAMVTSLWILGFGSYLQAMDQQTYVNIGGASTPGNYAADVSNPCVFSIL